MTLEERLAALEERVAELEAYQRRAEYQLEIELEAHRAEEYYE